MKVSPRQSWVAVWRPIELVIGIMPESHFQYSTSFFEERKSKESAGDKRGEVSQLHTACEGNPKTFYILRPKGAFYLELFPHTTVLWIFDGKHMAGKSLVTDGGKRIR